MATKKTTEKNLTTARIEEAPAAEASGPKKRGGSRPGAGRKPLLGRPLTATYRLRMFPELHEMCLARGGTYVRRVLERHFAEIDSANNAPNRFPAGAERVAAANSRVPELEMSAACGFPSPALDYATTDLDLNEFFLRHPADTFVVTASGDSMVDAGIYEGDKLFVDRRIEPRSGHIVLASVDGSYTVKRLFFEAGRPELHPENALTSYPVIRPRRLEDFSILGVVTSLGRRLV